MFRGLALLVLIFSSAAMAETKTYELKGMMCEACVESLQGEVCKIPGIDSCEIEVGKMTLVSAKNIDDKQVEKAVAKAGTQYKIIGVTSDKATKSK